MPSDLSPEKAEEQRKKLEGVMEYLFKKEKCRNRTLNSCWWKEHELELVKEWAAKIKSGETRVFLAIDALREKMPHRSVEAIRKKIATWNRFGVFF